ncbi:MAG: tRNA glutamyl-Q(34) synthetase GluQRS [Paracoccaceae bacterium]
MIAPTCIERFAPSPTGRLHLGHAYSAILAHDAAAATGGRFLLRLEDLDEGRVREAYVAQIFDDLAWLGLDWARPVLRQSARRSAYREALDRLAAEGLIYPCGCSRRDILEASSAPQEGAEAAEPGPDGPVYPGTCRRSPPQNGAVALRLHMDRAIARLGGPAAVARLGALEIGRGPRGETGWQPLDSDALKSMVGDVVLARKDGAAAYHLAVVVDDAHQGVSHVTRGEDLFAATPIHRVLQALLGLPTPVYRHHRLIRDESGRRLAKRDAARSLESLRASGETPAELRARLGLSSPSAQSRAGR